LARWRDIDDTILYPDAFIGIVERHNLTRRFTSLVAARAFEELSALPAVGRLRVNFNIFPRDLDGEALREIFSVFDHVRDRFEVTLEIVESGAIQVDSAQREIEALRHAGIEIYIDDFGTGYSNVTNLATLSVDGVKIDRAFALAPDGSLTAQMLVHAVEMIRATGRAMVIEGVETAERLAQLRNWATPLDHAQGYFISRPLPIDRFAAFLMAHEPQPAAAARRPGPTESAAPEHSRVVA
jgi:sensor c-di-GMP phosphodiesterase-like protein